MNPSRLIDHDGDGSGPSTTMTPSRTSYGVTGFQYPLPASNSVDWPRLTQLLWA